MISTPSMDSLRLLPAGQGPPLGELQPGETCEGGWHGLEGAGGGPVHGLHEGGRYGVALLGVRVCKACTKYIRLQQGSS